MEEIEIIGLDGEVTKIGNFQEEIIEENKWNFLNPKLCTNLRDAINSSTVFLYDPKYLAQYNLSCAVMDRLDTCISKLEQYGDYPESEEELLSFMMFSCMVVDAVQEIIMELTGCKREDLLSGTNEDYKFGFTAPSYHGASGSPVFNKYGKLVGIVNSGIDSSQGFNYAIKAECLLKLLNQAIITE